MSRPSTILVVDDEPRGRELIENLLLPQGHQLHLVADGPAALAAAAEHVPDLILLDVMMPGMDGFEVCRRLRADPKLRVVPVVMLTALDDRDSRIAGLAAGADSFLTKPFDATELRTRVTTITQLNRFRLLSAERERFAQLFNTAPDAILVIDPRFNIRLANPAARTLFGDDPAQPLENDLLLLRLSCDEPTLTRLKRLLNDGSGPVQFAAEALRPDGHRAPIQGAASRFPGSGEPALQLHLRDVTEFKQLEAQFLRVQRLQGLGSLAGGVAHDLNNIFAPLLLTMDLLQDTLAGKPELRLVQTMSVSARRGAGLVKQILTFARGTAGEKQSVPLRYVFNEVRGILTQALPANITIRTETDPDTPPVHADPTHLHQLLMNLCVNARDAMPAGGGIQLSAAPLTLNAETAASIPGATAGSWVRLSVRDTGTGMTPEVRARLGEAFFTTKPIGQGTGLGLATATTILKSHGGFWHIETALGQGTTFHLYLPPATEVTGVAAPEPESCPLGRGELILVADDEAAVLEILRATLACYGYRSLCARDGAEAIALYARQPADIALVLADCRMPFLEGTALLRALRKINPSVRCTLMSGTDAPPAAEPGEPALPWLAKPFTNSQLLTLLQQQLHP